MNLYKNDKTSIDLVEQGGGLCIKFSGTIDQADPGQFMDPILEKVHAQALEKKSRVDADFTNLSFLNSCGIKALIKWVMKLNTVPQPARYAIKLLYSSKITWQQSSLKAITFLAKDIVTIEPV